MTKETTYHEASEVVAKEGRVLIDGLDGVDAALGPEAGGRNL